MATVGLKGIWGLEQLDKTGIATWKLGLILMGAALLLGAVLTPILGGVNPDSFVTQIYTSRGLSTFLSGPLLMIGTNITFTLFLARNTEADFHLLSRKDGSVNESITRLQPKSGILLLCILVMIIANHSLLPAVNFVVLNMTLSESISAIHSSGLVINVLQYPILFTNALASAVLLTVGVTQSKSLIHVARFIKIDLLQLECYSAIANPAIRLIVFTLAIFSFFHLQSYLLETKVLLRQQLYLL